MSSTIRLMTNELPEAILEEAAIWQARLRETDQDISAQRKLRADFNQWLLSDARHRQAFTEMESLWGLLKTPAEQALAEQLPSFHTNRAIPVLSTAASPISRQPAARRTFQNLAMAACLVLAISTTIGWHQDWITRWQSDFVTTVGEQRPIVMPDNSHITLNTDSALAADYSSQERRVRLLKGEAWFNVASGDSRPFVVTTDAGAVRVTGTQFNVRLVADGAIVSLDEGKVELRVPGATEDAPVILAPGQQTVMSNNHIGDLTSFDHTAVTAWRRGQLVFYNTPLADVVDTLNRHRQGRILIASEELNALKVSGIFSTKDPDAALELITSTLPAQQTWLTSYLVLLH